MTDSGKLSPEGQRAIELFQEQLDNMPIVRNYSGITPEFCSVEGLHYRVVQEILADISALQSIFHSSIWVGAGNAPTLFARVRSS